MIRTAKWWGLVQLKLFLAVWGSTELVQVVEISGYVYKLGRVFWWLLMKFF